MICPGAHLLGMSLADADGVLRDFRERSRPISVGELTSAVAFGSVAASYFTLLRHELRAYLEATLAALIRPAEV